MPDLRTCGDFGTVLKQSMNFADEDQKSRFISRVYVRGETMSMDLTEPDAGSDLQSVMLKATEQPDGHMASEWC